MKPEDLVQVLSNLQGFHDDRLMVGLDTSDDAGVLRHDDHTALIQTVDFFTPIVDDPFTFGQIAAANALSDIYAMGGEPLTALNISCFPSSQLELGILREILLGGKDKLDEAGALLLGGHTIEDQEPKYGLSVLGKVHPDRIVTNAGAREGESMVLTKPIGGGVVATALKAGIVSSEEEENMVAVMSSLNKNAAEAMQEVGVSAATDITGFGLLGHAHEMAAASGVALEIVFDQVPVILGAWDLIARDVLPGGSRANYKYLEQWLSFPDGFSQNRKYMLCDAMTSGGLLISLPSKREEKLLNLLQQRQVTAFVIGRVTAGKPGTISIS